MRMSKINVFIIVLFVMFGVSTSHADLTHYINNNVGDRASGLGGAYTAISDDSSGCYYNPAGIALSPTNKFSASANALSSSTKVYKGVLEKVDGGAKDWEQESFTLLPNYFGIVQTFGPGMAGFSYAVPDSSQMKQKQSFYNIQGYDENSIPYTIESYNIDINQNDKAYLFGPSYSYRLNDSLTIGGTLYYYYRDSEIIYNQYISREDTNKSTYNVHMTQTQQGFKPILGLIWDPIDNVSVGLALSKLWLFDSEYEQQVISDSGSEITRSWITSSDKQDFPLSTSLGLAWFYSPSLLFSCDLKYFEEIEDRLSVLNMAVATEYYPIETFALRTGFYTDMSNAPDVKSSRPSDYDQIHIYGFSLSGTLFSGKSSLTIGVDWRYGQGDAQADMNSNTVYDVDYNTLTLHISTSFTY